MVLDTGSVYIEPSECQHLNSVLDGSVGGPDNPISWEQDPSYTRRDLQGIGMYAQLGSCPNCGSIVVRMASGNHKFDENDITEILVSGWVTMYRDGGHRPAVDGLLAPPSS